MNVPNLRRRLKALEAMTVANGCTPNEASIAKLKAAELRKRLPKNPEQDLMALLADIERQIAKARAERKTAADAIWGELRRARA